MFRCLGVCFLAYRLGVFGVWVFGCLVFGCWGVGALGRWGVWRAFWRLVFGRLVFGRLGVWAFGRAFSALGIWAGVWDFEVSCLGFHFPSGYMNHNTSRGWELGRGFARLPGTSHPLKIEQGHQYRTEVRLGLRDHFLSRGWELGRGLARLPGTSHPLERTHQ